MKNLKELNILKANLMDLISLNDSRTKSDYWFISKIDYRLVKDDLHYYIFVSECHGISTINYAATTLYTTSKSYITKYLNDFEFPDHKLGTRTYDFTNERALHCYYLMITEYDYNSKRGVNNILAYSNFLKQLKDVSDEEKLYFEMI